MAQQVPDLPALMSHENSLKEGKSRTCWAIQDFLVHYSVCIDNYLMKMHLCWMIYLGFFIGSSLQGVAWSIGLDLFTHVGFCEVHESAAFTNSSSIAHNIAAICLQQPSALKNN